MEFPDNANTNVYRISGINSVHWALYSFEDSTTPQCRGENSIPTPHDDYSYDLDEFHTNIQHKMQHELRSRGYHVMQSNSNGNHGLWVFNLSELKPSTVDDRSIEDDVLQMMKSSDVKYLKLASGSLDASESYRELMMSQNYLYSGIGDSERTNSHTSFSKSSFSSISGVQDIEESKGSPVELACETLRYADILPKMIEAISLSILYDLATYLLWTPIGCRSFVKTPISEVSMNPSITLWPSLSPAQTSLLSLSLFWWPSGALTISCSCETSSEMRRVSEMLLNDTQTSEPAILSNLLIAPSGRIAEYHGKLQLSASPEASSNKDLQGIRVLDESATQAKALVIYRLAQQGINIEQEKMWLQLETPDEYLDNQDGNSQLGIFIWPASLCFALIRNDQQEEILNSPSNLVLEKCKDPLERAESWFNARQIREEMIEMKRKNDEATTKLVKEASQLDEDDGACEIPPHPNQYISAQDASSIYPTPPDGLRSQVLGSSMNNETHASTGSSGAKEAIDDLNNETSMNVSPFISALDPVISSSSYIQSESTDIFGEIDGEMDSELFAANGLTEDDFSFFDKPTAEENIDLHDDQATDSIENEALEIRPNGFVQDRMRKPATEHSSDSKIEPDLRGNDQIIKGLLLKQISDDLGAEAGSLSKNSYTSNIPELLQPSSKNSVENEQMLYPEDVIQGIQGTEAKGEISFRPVLFKEKLEDFDVKYFPHGKFGYQLEDNQGNPPFPELPKISEAKISRIKVPLKESTEHPSNWESSSELDDQSAETDTVTSASESLGNDSLFETSNESKVMISRKRKREQEETTKTETPLFSDCSPVSDGPKLDHFLSSPSKDIFAPSTDSIFKSSIAAWSRKLHPMPSKYSGNDRKFIQVAQIFAEQMILQTDFTTNPPEATKPFYNRLLWEKADTDEDLLRDTMGRLFPQSEMCSLKQYADIGKGATESTQGVSIGRLQKEHSFKPKTRPSPKAQPNLFQLEAPYTCIRRNQTPMDVLPSALLFWEELGLGPSHGEKNIVTLCMCPEIDYVQQGAKTFLGMLGSAYQSCKLGSHTQFPDTTGYSDGIVPVHINDGSFVSFIKELDRVCEKLGTDIAKLSAEGGNTVIYMLNPFRTSQVIPHLCSAIITLFESYSLSLKAQQQVLSPNDLILQIIPLDLVASPNAIILPSPLAYRRLAFEVYDRCPPNPISDKANNSRYLCTPSVQLARKLPKTINLKLSSEPSASLLQSDFCFHLAYSWDPDREWLIASWTDNQGSLQWNTPYSLGVGEIEGCWPILLNVIKEIWETTLEMLHPRNSPWRLYIAKDSPMYKKELEAWLSISTLPQKHPITSTFITIDSSPPLRFPPPPLPKISILPTPNVYSTPSSTPAAQTVSPDPTGLVSTPGSNLLNPPTPTPASGPPDGDTDARLIDITDESWGLVLPVANVDALLPPWLCGPLASGYLLKRGGTRDEDGLLAIGVNVVHAELKGIDPLLRDVLAMYRDLAALARIRGVVDRVKGMLPWHVAAARRAGASINRLMTWDEEGKS